MLHSDLSKSTLDLLDNRATTTTVASSERGSLGMQKLTNIQELDKFNEDQDIELNRKALLALGGIVGLESCLGTSFVNGISSNSRDIETRINEYGTNFIKAAESKTWIGIFLGSFEDTTLIVLIVAAVVSLIVGTYDDPDKGWIEGAAILFAVLLVACVTATNDYNKDLQFRKLNAVKDDVNVTVIRDGKIFSINIKEILVGDIVQLNTGDRIPADGVIIKSSDIRCDESALTGEPKEKHKSSDDVEGDPFMLSGAHVISGYGFMVVTAVGMHSRWGKIKSKLNVKSADTPLQEKLDTLAGQIGNIGTGAAIATFIAMMGLWYIRPETRREGDTLLEYVIKSFIVAVTIVVVAVPEGLPLAVTLSLAFSTKQMMKDNNLIRVLAACETMGNATNICSDKTGTLTQNRMTVVDGWIAGGIFENAASMSPLVKAVISEGISVNSTAELSYNERDEVNVLGSKTEGALLLFLRTCLSMDYVSIRSKGFDMTRGDTLFSFSSARKRMSVLVVPSKESGRLYTKGAAEIVLASCDKYLTPEGKEAKLDAATKEILLGWIDKMARNANRCIAIAHKSVPAVDLKLPSEELETALVIDAIFGIKDPLRPDVAEAVKSCQQAGVFVRMITGDNIDTAMAIAKECGILTEGGKAIDGPEFRKLTPAQVDEILPLLQVIGRCSPTDKHILVNRLNGTALPNNEEEWAVMHPDGDFARDKDTLLPGYKEEWMRSRKDGVGDVVGVTGDGTNDAPALKVADVGLSMGISGTEVAKEASDIVILDDNFSSIVKAVMWGRSVFDNIRKFLQFQLTVNVVALTLTFCSALTGYELPLNAVMMLWVNLIMDTMGALALGTEPPSPTLLERRPYKRNASLINSLMLRNIAFQSIFQLGLLFYLLLYGAPDFGATTGSHLHLTVVFNTFVFCQIFNEFNARSIGNEMNVFKGIVKNPLFLAIIGFTGFSQYCLVEYGGDWVRTESLSNDQFFRCIILGGLSLTVGGFMRLFPVSESENNYAPLYPLMKQMMKDAPKSKAGTELSPSFFVWLFAVGLFPSLVFQSFGEQWIARIQGR